MSVPHGAPLRSTLALSFPYFLNGFLSTFRSFDGSLVNVSSASCAHFQVFQIELKAILGECESMFHPRQTPSKLLVPSIVIVTVLISIHLAQAKSMRSLGYSNLRASDAIKMRRGGCAAFGHSCFGGHGKRSEGGIVPGEGEEVGGAGSGLQGAAEDLKAFIVSDGVRTPVEIFSRDQPENELSVAMPPSQFQSEEFVKFSPLFRKWLANSYRRGDLVAGN